MQLEVHEFNTRQALQTAFVASLITIENILINLSLKKKIVVKHL